MTNEYRYKLLLIEVQYKNYKCRYRSHSILLKRSVTLTLQHATKRGSAHRPATHCENVSSENYAPNYARARARKQAS